MPYLYLVKLKEAARFASHSKATIHNAVKKEEKQLDRLGKQCDWTSTLGSSSGGVACLNCLTKVGPCGSVSGQ